MHARLVAFGEIEVEGHLYSHDIVIERGHVRKRRKGPSRALRDEFGHTPLSAEEAIPWHRPRLIVGTGLDGALPVMPQVIEEGRRRGVEVVVLPTEQACRALRDLAIEDANAVLHVTC